MVRTKIEQFLQWLFNLPGNIEIHIGTNEVKIPIVGCLVLSFILSLLTDIVLRTLF